jgi:ribose transport system permease protein
MQALASRSRADLLRQWTPVLTLVVLIAIVGAVTPQFLTFDSMIVLAADTATLFVMATGVTFVILLGGIDLSIQAMASLASVVVALTIGRLGYLSFPFAVLVGAAIGFLGALAHVRLKIPSFISTLAVGGVVSGVALVISQARSITFNESGRSYLGWISGSTFNIPHEVVIGAIVLVGAHIVQSRTRFGRYSAAVGAGEEAAFASGIDVGRTKLIALTLSAALAALSGVVLAGRMASGSPTLANQLLLPAIAAVIVGGTAMTGGVGSIGRTLVGALIISVVRIGMTFIGVDIFAQQIVFGIVLILAVAATIDRSKIPIVK